MGKVKNYLQEKAEDFMHEIEDKVSKGKMTKGCAYKLSVDRKDEIAFDLVGFDSEDIARYNLGYCSEGIYNNRIIIPSYDSDGKLNYFVGRDFYNSNFKYMNPPNVSKDVVGFDLYVNWSLPIILVEGVFDAMSVKGNAIPLFGKSILPQLEKKITEKRVNSIFIVLDGDAFNDAIQMVEKFTDNGISVNFVKLDGKDPNDLGYKKMITKIHNSLPMDFKQIMEMKLYGKKLLAN